MGPKSRAAGTAIYQKSCAVAETSHLVLTSIADIEESDLEGFTDKLRKSVLFRSQWLDD